MAKKQTPEGALTANVVMFLQLKGYSIKKIYNGGTPARVVHGQIVYKKKPEEYKGVPDLLAYNDKNFFFIEMKRLKGTVKPHQKEFLESFNKCQNYEALVIRDFAEIEEIIKAKG